MPYIVLDESLATVIPTPVPNPAAPGTVGITLAQAEAEVRAMLTGRTDIPPERIRFWLNRAYIDLATSAKKLDELKSSLTFNTVADQGLYLLPDLTFSTMTLSRADPTLAEGGVPLEKIDLPAYRRRRAPVVGTERRPNAYLKMNRLLALDYIPGDAYEMILDFRFEPLPLVADTDCPIFNSEWHETWILLARKKVHAALSEWEASIAAGNEFVGNARVRQDREGAEEEGRIVSSSAPRTHEELRRRNLRRRGF